MEWGQKVFEDRVWWGDVDIFCEHHAGDSDEWGVAKVELWGDKYKQYSLLNYEVILMRRNDWECETYYVNCPKMSEKDLSELTEGFFILGQKEYCGVEVISIREI
jgi:hypothetical protein